MDRVRKGVGGRASAASDKRVCFCNNEPFALALAAGREKEEENSADVERTTTSDLKGTEYAYVF